MLLAQGYLTAFVSLLPCTFVEILEIFRKTDVLVFGPRNECAVSGSHDFKPLKSAYKQLID